MNSRTFKERRRVAQSAKILSLLLLAATGFFTSCKKENKPAPVAPEVSANESIGVVSTLAGSGDGGFNDAIGTAAQFHEARGIAADALGNVYVADTFNERIRKITPQGVVSTLAGSGVAGYADGVGTAAQFYHPGGVAVDAQGNVYVADSNNNRIRKITTIVVLGQTMAIVSTLAGSEGAGSADGIGTTAKFSSPRGVAVDVEGNVYVADSDSQRIRKINQAGVVSTLAGSTYGYAEGTGTQAKFAAPEGIAVDTEGNVYVADRNNHRIRKINQAGVVSTLAGGDNTAPPVVAAAPPAADGPFYYPYGVAVDAQKNVYVADTFNHRIRKVTPAGLVSTLAGTGIAGYKDGKPSTAQFHYPYGVAVNAQNNVYVADTINERIRKILYFNIIII